MEQDLDAHYVLGNDINATGYTYTSVGSGIDPFPATIDGIPFNGTLDGQGHVITGLSIHEDGDSFVGLFGAVDSSGVVTNVGLEDIDIRGQSGVGGLVGLNSGTVSDSYWDTQTTGQSISDGGTGLTTPQMTGEAATTNMDGFDFTTTWTTTDAYPILQWQPPPIQVIAEITPDNLDEGENATITATRYRTRRALSVW